MKGTRATRTAAVAPVAFALVAVASSALLACSNSLKPLPLDVRVQASRTTAVVGDTITFVVDAQGDALVGVAIDYGDLTLDRYQTRGARTARVTFTHAYGAPDSYAVQAVATDTKLGEKSATTQVTVR